MRCSIWSKSSRRSRTNSKKCRCCSLISTAKTVCLLYFTHGLLTVQAMQSRTALCECSPPTPLQPLRTLPPTRICKSSSSDRPKLAAIIRSARSFSVQLSDRARRRKCRFRVAVGRSNGLKAGQSSFSHLRQGARAPVSSVLSKKST